MKKKAQKNNVTTQKILKKFEESKDDLDKIVDSVSSSENYSEENTIVREVLSSKTVSKQEPSSLSNVSLSNSKTSESIKRPKGPPSKMVDNRKQLINDKASKPIAKSNKEEVSLKGDQKTKKVNLADETHHESEETKVKNLFDSFEKGDTTKVNDNHLILGTPTKTESTKGDTTFLNEKFSLANSQTSSISGPSEQFKNLIETVRKKAIQIIPFEKICNNGELLGEGGFGAVFKGVWSGINVAIKEMTISIEEFSVMDAEMTFMSKYRHPRLVNTI
jgi:hypothetical protein